MATVDSQVHDTAARAILTAVYFIACSVMTASIGLRMLGLWKMWLWRLELQKTLKMVLSKEPENRTICWSNWRKIMAKTRLWRGELVTKWWARKLLPVFIAVLAMIYVYRCAMFLLVTRSECGIAANSSTTYSTVLSVFSTIWLLERIHALFFTNLFATTPSPMRFRINLFTICILVGVIWLASVVYYFINLPKVTKAYGKHCVIASPYRSATIIANTTTIILVHIFFLTIFLLPVLFKMDKHVISTKLANRTAIPAFLIAFADINKAIVKSEAYGTEIWILIFAYSMHHTTIALGILWASEPTSNITKVQTSPYGNDSAEYVDFNEIIGVPITTPTAARLSQSAN